MIWLLGLLLQVPLPNATVTFNPGGAVTTNAQGRYEKILQKPWTGTITASFPGCSMAPTVISATGVQADSQVVEFACSDVQAPTVQITAPRNNGTISRTALLRADAADNIAVVRVVWSLDGTPIGTVTAAPWSLPYQFGRLTAWHMLSAQAFDAAGNQATSSVRFRVK